MHPSHTHSVTTESDSYPGRRRISILVMLKNVLHFKWYEVWNRLYHVINGKSDLKRRLGIINVSGVIGRWSWFYLHIYAVKYVYFWILQRRLAQHWGAGVIHAGLRRGYLRKNSWIELCMVDKAGNIRKQLWLRIPKGIKAVTCSFNVFFLSHSLRYVCNSYSYLSLLSICNNSYRINVYRFRAFWLDKSTITCLFLILS